MPDATSDELYQSPSQLLLNQPRLLQDGFVVCLDTLVLGIDAVCFLNELPR